MGRNNGPNGTGSAHARGIAAERDIAMSTIYTAPGGFTLVAAKVGSKTASKTPVTLNAAKGTIARHYPADALLPAIAAAENVAAALALTGEGLALTGVRASVSATALDAWKAAILASVTPEDIAAAALVPTDVPTVTGKAREALDTPEARTKRAAGAKMATALHSGVVIIPTVTGTAGPKRAKGEDTTAAVIDSLFA